MTERREGLREEFSAEDVVRVPEDQDGGDEVRREVESQGEIAAEGDGDEEGAAPLLADEDAGGFRSRWNEIQVRFVDEPRGSVQKADGLVAEMRNGSPTCSPRRGRGWRASGSAGTTSPRRIFASLSSVTARSSSGCFPPDAGHRGGAPRAARAWFWLEMLVRGPSATPLEASDQHPPVDLLLAEDADAARPDEQADDDEDDSSEEPAPHQGHDAGNDKDRCDDPKDRGDARPTRSRC